MRGELIDKVVERMNLVMSKQNGYRLDLAGIIEKYTGMLLTDDDELKVQVQDTSQSVNEEESTSKVLRKSLTVGIVIQVAKKEETNKVINDFFSDVARFFNEEIFELRAISNGLVAEYSDDDKLIEEYDRIIGVGIVNYKLKYWVGAEEA